MTRFEELILGDWQDKLFVSIFIVICILLPVFAIYRGIKVRYSALPPAIAFGFISYLLITDSSIEITTFSYIFFLSMPIIVYLFFILVLDGLREQIQTEKPSTNFSKLLIGVLASEFAIATIFSSWKTATLILVSLFILGMYMFDKSEEFLIRIGKNDYDNQTIALVRTRGLFLVLLSLAIIAVIVINI